MVAVVKIEGVKEMWSPAAQEEVKKSVKPRDTHGNKYILCYQHKSAVELFSMDILYA